VNENNWENGLRYGKKGKLEGLGTCHKMRNPTNVQMFIWFEKHHQPE
jgi:hypothetical protein